ncbi:hypothetical protein [Bosea sp. ASV33]|uniref:hypothetical protein n=1 Tax=Bosea sp. ASV33 TaxID=2795106 RepID=UPI0018EA7CE0|nr:hypothetical protein [Bosea sp. ASV33]
MINRRSFLSLTLAGASLALLPAGLSPVLAQGAPIGSVSVVFSPTVLEGWGDNVAVVRSELERTLAEILGPGYQRGAGNRLVVSVSSLWLASAAGGNGGGGGRRHGDGGGSDSDYLESTVTLYDRAGRALESWPIRSTENGNGVLWTLPDASTRRLAALARNNAWWIKHYLA